VAVGVGLTVGVVVGLGTVMKGNHWPTDVVGGLLVGFVALVTGVAVVRTQVSRRAGVRR
jgi:membrane-associated phospholipid phosphatase